MRFRDEMKGTPNNQERLRYVTYGVSRQGFEPWTLGLKVRCSDQTELPARWRAAGGRHEPSVASKRSKTILAPRAGHRLCRPSYKERLGRERSLHATITAGNPL